MNHRYIWASAFAALLLWSSFAIAQEAELYFIEPQDGAEVSGPVKVVFGLTGKGVAPAGIAFDNTGHHHLLINTGLPEDMSQPIPADDNHRHFGGGQTQTVVELEPGEYTLQLLLGNHLHVPHDPPVYSEQITITVK